MFVVHDDMTIYATRGDVVYFPVEKKVGETKYKFLPEDIVRIKVFEKKNCSKVVLIKDFLVEEECTSVNIFLDKNEMKFGEIISKPTDYWYEVELNPDTYPDTFIGYNEDGPALFKLFPEGKDVTEGEIPDPGENAAVGRMVVTFVNEYLGKNAETIIREAILREEYVDTIIQQIIREDNLETIIQELIREENIETIVQEIIQQESIETIVHEIIKEENIETIIQEIVREEHIETIVQEIIREENVDTIIQEILKPENTTTIVEQVLEHIEQNPESFAGLNGATFTPSVDAEGNLIWTNNGGLANPEPVNIKGYNPVKGVDYYTDAEKVEMVNAVIARLTNADEVSY